VQVTQPDLKQTSSNELAGALDRLQDALILNGENGLLLAEAQAVVDAADAVGIDSLIRLLRNDYWLVRSKACESLGDRNYMPASSELARLLGDENTTVRSRAREALEEIHDYKLSEGDCAKLYTSVTGNVLPMEQDRRLFISYSRKDSGFASRLVDDLRRAHVTVWIDSVVIANDDASEGEVIDAVAPGIRSSEFLVTVLSQHSAASAWVDREMRIARLFQRYRNPITVVAAMLDSTNLPTVLQGYQPLVALDFSSGGSYESSLGRLIGLADSAKTGGAPVNDPSNSTAQV
jgi:TIR domain/HEAT repeats